MCSCKMFMFFYISSFSYFRTFIALALQMRVSDLQPAVESFFLVHATAAEERRLAADGREVRSAQEQRTRENPAPPEVAIIQPDVAPATDSDGNAATQPAPVCFNFNWEVTPSPVTLSPDQQKFLKFAGLLNYENNM